jgi:hypothetical protein
MEKLPWIVRVENQGNHTAQIKAHTMCKPCMFDLGPKRPCAKIKARSVLTFRGLRQKKSRGSIPPCILVNVIFKWDDPQTRASLRGRSSKQNWGGEAVSSKKSASQRLWSCDRNYAYMIHRWILLSQFKIQLNKTQLMHGNPSWDVEQRKNVPSLHLQQLTSNCIWTQHTKLKDHPHSALKPFLPCFNKTSLQDLHKWWCIFLRPIKCPILATPSVLSFSGWPFISSTTIRGSCRATSLYPCSVRLQLDIQTNRMLLKWCIPERSPASPNGQSLISSFEQPWMMCWSARSLFPAKMKTRHHSGRPGPGRGKGPQMYLPCLYLHCF